MNSTITNNSSFFYHITILLVLCSQCKTLESTCSIESPFSIIDISSSKIIKTNTYEFSIEVFDQQQNISRNEFNEIVFTGNLSLITLKNKGLQKQYNYEGKELIFRIPSSHNYAKQKSAAAEIQIVYYLDEKEGVHKENSHKVVTMSQMYLVSRFKSKVETSLHDQINSNFVNGTTLYLSKLLKIIENTSMLMYKGAKQIYPCRNDLLCMVRKQFVLVSQEDIDHLKQEMQIGSTDEESSKRKAYPQKQILEISQFKRNCEQQHSESEL